MTVRLLGTPWVLSLTLVLCCCKKDSLPTAPSDVTSGLTVYEDANYLGESALITSSIADLTDFDGPCAHTETSGSPIPVTTTTYDWNDCISSIRIAPGWRAVVYRGWEYDDDALEVTGNVPNLQLVRGDCSHDGMNDCISSIKLTPP